MSRLARIGEMVAGMHFQFPPFGWVRDLGGGGFGLERLVWTPDVRHVTVRA